MTSDDVARCRTPSCVKASSAVVRCRAHCEHLLGFRFKLIFVHINWEQLFTFGRPVIDVYSHILGLEPRALKS